MEIAAFIGVAALLIWANWVRHAIRRWWYRGWRAIKHRAVRAPIDVPKWMWRRACLLFVPGWLSERDFYQTPEWRRVAVENKRDYGYRCVVCTISNSELPSGSALHSHHVRKRLRAPWLALRKSNLVPLCPSDHRDVEHGRVKLVWRNGRWHPKDRSWQSTESHVRLGRS